MQFESTIRLKVSNIKNTMLYIPLSIQKLMKKTTRASDLRSIVIHELHRFRLEVVIATPF